MVESMRQCHGGEGKERALSPSQSGFGVHGYRIFIVKARSSRPLDASMQSTAYTAIVQPVHLRAALLTAQALPCRGLLRVKMPCWTWLDMFSSRTLAYCVYNSCMLHQGLCFSRGQDIFATPESNVPVLCKFCRRCSNAIALAQDGCLGWNAQMCKII